MCIVDFNNIYYCSIIIVDLKENKSNENNKNYL